MIPYIDPSVKHVPISYLRRLNLEALRQETSTLVVDGFDGEDPLSVIVPYKVFLAMQEERNDENQ